MFKKLFGKQKEMKMGEGLTDSTGNTENAASPSTPSTPSAEQKTLFVQYQEYLDQVKLSEDPKLDRFLKGFISK